MNADYACVFQSAHAAIAAEHALLECGVAARVMPTPAAISSGCGICLRVRQAQLESALQMLKTQNIITTAYALDGAYTPYRPDRSFSNAFGLRHGDIAAIVGSGGKTSLLYRLAAENRGETVLLATTTRIFPPPDIVDHINPDELKAGVNLLHGGQEGEKLTPPDSARLKALCPANGYAFLECDGSKRLPLKGWAAYEPVVPDYATLTIGVCTLGPVGQPLSLSNTHRLPEFLALTGARAGETVTLSHIAAMIARGLFKNAAGRRYLLINQVEDEGRQNDAQALLKMLPRDFTAALAGIIIGSIQKDMVWGGETFA